MLRGVVAPCYQHQQYGSGVGNKVPQLQTTQSEPLDYTNLCVRIFLLNKLTFKHIVDVIFIEVNTFIILKSATVIRDSILSNVQLRVIIFCLNPV